ARRQSLVAKDAADLIHALKPADEQPLEVQLECDPQKQIPIQRVVMSLKRPGMTAPRNFLEHRCLDIDEASLVQEASNRSDDLAARPKHLADLRIGDQVHVSLPVASL